MQYIIDIYVKDFKTSSMTIKNPIEKIEVHVLYKKNLPFLTLNFNIDSNK